jgi:hypothetical protein
MNAHLTLQGLRKPRLQRRARPLHRATWVLIGVEAVTAANAFGGAVYALGGAPNVPLEWLDGSPFHSYVVPGLILGGVVGGSQLIAAVSLLRRRPYARTLSSAACLALLGWIATQVAIIGYVSPLQPLMVAVGLLILWLTRRVPS